MLMEGYRLSPQQRHLWALLKTGERSSYTASSLVSVRGLLNADVLAAALDKVVEKHEILRSRFRLSAEAEAMVSGSGTRIRVLDIRDDIGDLPAGQQEARIEELLREASHTRFDLERDPLLRLTQLSLAAERHALILTAPALCADGASLVNLVAEIARCYQTGPESLPMEALQYSEIAGWQNDLLESEESRPDQEYWGERNLPAHRAIELPFEKPFAPAGFIPEIFRRPVDPRLAAKLRTFLDRNGGSLPDVLLAGWIALLYRLTGLPEMVIGVHAGGRGFEELTDSIGLLSKYLPAGAALDPETPFRTVVESVRQEREQAEKRQESFAWDAPPAAAGDREPFFPYGFEFQRLGRAVAAGEVTFEIQDLIVYADRFRCLLTSVEQGDSLSTRFTWDPSVFEESAVRRLAAMFHALLDDAVARPETRIGHLDMLGEAERKRLLVDFNDTDADYPRDRLIHGLFEEQARQSPEKPAIVFGDRVWTYAELDARANQLAHRLGQLGVGPDVLVGLCVERSFEMVAGILGILKAGGAYVPIDPAYPKERITFLVEDSRAAVLLTQRRLLADLPETPARLLCLDDEEIAPQSATPPQVATTPDNLVYVIYTSGSTGKPKGVMVTHRKLMISNCARVRWFEHIPQRFLLLSSHAFDSSVVGIFWTLCYGGALVLIPRDQQHNLGQLTELVARHRVSHLLTLPSLYMLILEYAKAGELDRLRTAIVAGEPCPRKMVDRHRELLPNTRLYSEYGATETTVFSSVYDCLTQTLPLAPLGSPIDNARMYILDPRLKPVPVGVPGEVHFGGVALALGYWNRPELTAERFIPNPFGREPGERLYKSGDLARHLENGDIEFLGRVDNQVKIRGYRIELEEIEAVLDQHPAIREAVVAARADRSEEKRLVAYLASNGAGNPSVGDLRTFIGERLPDYMVPSVFVFLEDLPRTPNGKVDRKALPEPGSDRPELEESFVAPRSDAERTLASIWAGLLALERVGIHDNFFELGGDSILSIQIVSRANQAGLKLTPRQMFQFQTIAELAAACETAAPRVARAEQGVVTGPAPLTQTAHWFFELDVPEPDHWNMPMLVEMARPVAAARLEQAVLALLRHHDALRLRFRRTPAGWSGELAPADDAAPVHVVDLSATPEADQTAALETEASKFQATLNLERGPITRLVYFDMGRRRSPRLLWIIHHLAADGVSWRVLLEDLQTALGQLERGEPIRFPPKTTSIKHWATRLKEFAASGQFADEIEYWLSIAGEPFSPLPVDYPGGANTEASARIHTVALSAEETRALLTEVPRLYNTQINDVLIAALFHAVAGWTGRNSLLVNLEGHGREEVFADVDLSRTVGWFTTDFPVLLRGEAVFEPATLLPAIKDQLRRIPNQGFGFGVWRYLSGNQKAGEKLRRLPRPGIGFNYLGQFDQVFRDDSLFRPAREPIGPDRGLKGNRVFVVEVYGAVSEGRLRMDFEYSANLHKRSTVEKLAEEFRRTLGELTSHPVSRQTAARSSSDFADFNWGQGDIESITRAIEKTRRGA